MSVTDNHHKACRRYDEPGHAHYLTFSCFRRQPFFRGRRSPGWFLDAVAQARQELRFDLWAWVIMPEHVHLLLRPAPESQISGILWRIKRRVTHEATRYLAAADPEFLERRLLDGQPNGRFTHRFWQRGGGYDRNLWRVGELREKVDYIHANPVRRGLVAHPRDWPWSSWRAWNEEANDPLPIDRESLPVL
ncbi:MAG TPA: transposase [Phycisphaerae bacterium]|nr:transposase [Phycisphaerae bacterium]HOI56125.1 transposase [Phycisphaerae bacterium]